MAVDADKEQRVIAMLDRYKGKATVERLRAELAGKSDAYRGARFDSLLAEEPRYQHAALVAEVVVAGNREERAQQHRCQAFRTDAGGLLSYAPSVRWPAGFDRKKAIEAIEAAGVNALTMHPGSAFASLAKASDAWLVGALNHLLRSTFANDGISSAMSRLGYLHTDRGWILRNPVGAR